MQVCLLIACVLAAPTDGTDLSGQVTDSQGRPIDGAQVFVYTAKPRKGTSPLCPWCYRDCAKKTATNDDGEFTIPSLDPALLFRILAVAEGHRAQIIGHIDPAEGPAKIELEPTPKDLGPQHVLRGRIVTQGGLPIAGAVVEPFGTKTEMRRWWGRMPDVDAVAVTNASGEFRITTKEPKLGFDLDITARGFAARKIPLLSTGDEVHEIQLTSGAAVAGRLMKGEQPLPEAIVGLVQRNRATGSFIGEYQVTTDRDGYFLFTNIHPNDEYVLYTKMDDLKNVGALETVRLNVGADDSTTDAGTLKLGATSTIAGQVQLTDGTTLPPDTRIMMSREEAWDQQSVTLDDEGKFRFVGVPHEAVSMHIRVPGYRLASRQNRFQQTGSNRLAIFVDEDRPDLQIFLQPGDK